jgi:curved DNA-binding protein CbpA
MDELKSSFKTLAKRIHPDLQGPEASDEAFASLRREYEAALLDFPRLRFGSGAPRARQGRFAPGGQGEGGNPARPSSRAFEGKRFYGELAALRRRGFPKLPRHDKERLKYEYGRFLVLASLAAWGEGRASLFEAFERSLLEGTAAADGNARQRAGKALAIFDAILAARASGAMERESEKLEKASIELEFRNFAVDGGGEASGPERVSGLRRGGGEADPYTAFLSLLVEDLGPGAARSGV